jgi:uncharacterized protein YkwD
MGGKAHRYGIAVVLLVAALAATSGAASGQDPTPTPTPTPVSGALGDATVASPDRERVTSTGGPIGSTVIPQDADFPSCPQMNTEVTAETATKVEAAALCLINKLRRQKHLRALKNTPQLHKAAQQHARDMVANAYFSHESLGGRDVSDRVRRAGYLRGYPGWQIGENLAWGSGVKSSARQIVVAWMGSPGHKQNLMNRKFREAGMAVAPGAPVAVDGAAGRYANVFGTRSR